MFKSLHEHLANWSANPRRARPDYIAARLWHLAGVRLRSALRLQNPPEPLDPPVETGYVEIFQNSTFRRSVAQVRDRSCLDMVRLANLWHGVRAAEPGCFLEIGTYRGGTALHICNAIDAFRPGSPFYCFDPFERGGYESVGPDEGEFTPNDFMNTSYSEVAKLLAAKPDATVVQGYFPAAAEAYNLHDISFCHLDINVYSATLASLQFLAPRLTPGGIVMLDDIGRCETPGVRRAVMEFLAQYPSFFLIELFPCQGLLVSRGRL